MGDWDEQAIQRINGMPVAEFFQSIGVDYERYVSDEAYREKCIAERRASAVNGDEIA